ncbi:MAG: D-2-hydroxyacid dehydrogenase [Lachnospiraceae bacterium]|nr:D-2-hydroxyacid dehydrogenase [Lachnospiraceae bacterium]MBQ8317004.1 D-2-hydroxyacid dehydrogenase [Lachnospiraceae bacterium]
MKLVFLDRKTIGDDIDLSMFQDFGEVVEYNFSTEEEVLDRAADADILVINKIPINEKTIKNAKKLKLVCVTATGTNNLDKDYLASRGIQWRNVAGYSTESVAQHTFSMLFYLLEHMSYYDEYTKNGHYINDTMFTHFDKVFPQISGKTWGIIGLGAIGRRVADIAKCFGANVIYYSASGAPKQEGYNQVDFDTLLTNSDIISIHAPLNEYTENLISYEALSKMKKSSILLNLGRGPIIDEAALSDALNSNKISAAGLDVLSIEPMNPQCPLLNVKDKSKLLITPHIGWASVEARTNLMNIIYGQIKEYLSL